MENLCRLILIRFEYLTAKCLFPIILNWQQDDKAQYEVGIINKIFNELNNLPGVSKVRVVHNKVDSYIVLKQEFNEIIGDINFNTESSQIKTLNVDLRVFKDLTKKEIEEGFVERFAVYNMYFPVKIYDPETITLYIMRELPLLVIEQRLNEL